MRIWALRRLRESAGSYAASVAVVAVVATFAVLLIEAIDVLREAIVAAGADGGTTAIALGSVGAVFLGIAVLTAGVVVLNTFTTVYVGKLQEIALLRLVGATSGQVRRTALLDGAAVGAAGSAIGMAAGGIITAVSVAALNSSLGARLAAGLPPQLLLVPVAGVAATTTVAFAAARWVSRTSPVAAVGAAVTASEAPGRRLRARAALGLVAVGLGAALLAAGSLAGVVTPLGVLIAFAGGVLSIIGVITAAPTLLLPLLRRLAALLPRTAAVRLATTNLLAQPLRTARTVLAVTIGVTLITMFVVAGRMLLIAGTRRTHGMPGAEQVMNGLLTAVAVLTSFSIVVAAIGVASTLSLSVLQRRREIGLLRATGMTRRQVRRMLLAEAVLCTGTGAVAGLVLGVAYGFAGYTSILGSIAVLPPQLPLPYVGGSLLVAVGFGLAASVAPGWRASTVPPAEALRTL